jgi:transcriptional regulator with XRE-family HTH domain
MPSTNPRAIRFREARERAGLSPAEAATRMGISTPCVWDIETYDDELESVYSPANIQRFCLVLAISPAELFGIQVASPAITIKDLVTLIRDYCQAGGLNIEQFENAAGWHIAASLDDPECFLHDYTIDGIKHICEELKVDWQRFMLSL